MQWFPSAAFSLSHHFTLLQRWCPMGCSPSGKYPFNCGISTGLSSCQETSAPPGNCRGYLLLCGAPPHLTLMLFWHFSLFFPHFSVQCFPSFLKHVFPETSPTSLVGSPVSYGGLLWSQLYPAVPNLFHLSPLSQTPTTKTLLPIPNTTIYFCCFLVLFCLLFACLFLKKCGNHRAHS